MIATQAHPPPAAAPPAVDTAQATLDSEGRLVAADAALLSLNARAGGGIGLALALPPLASAARLARRLGITVSRGLVVADAGHDIELWVRASPEGEGVRLCVSDWRERPAAPADTGPAAGRDFLAAAGAWGWRTDAGLRLTRLSIEAGRRHGFDAIALIGEPVTALFALDGAPGAAPLVEALARRRPLAEQRAWLLGGGEVVLSAEVRRDATGAFAGFDGVARAVEPPAVPLPTLPDGFTAGLDRALRRPLAQIVANADSIHAATDGPIATDYADYAADIAHAGRHLLALVDDLVDLR